ncbi:MAG: DHH family phosphoesterase [Chloroflexi bacterium]|nr:DHH family phosphoesterase [Chloroflexota bacterium]
MDETHRRVQMLLDVVKRWKRVAILGHDNPDPDSIASALGLSRLFSAELGLETPILYGGIVGRAENRSMLESLGIKLSHLRNNALEEYDGVVLVDTQPGAGNNSLPSTFRQVAVIDHHPLQANSSTYQYVDVRPEYGALSTIIFEYLVSAGISVETDIATALFHGIKSETLDLARRATPSDIEAYVRLFPLVDLRKLAEIQHPRVPRHYFEDTRVAMERAFIYDGVIISDIGPCSSPDTVAEMADFLLRLEGVSWSICLGQFAGQIYFSVRTSEPKINAGELVRKVAGSLGSAGGHDAVAGGRIPIANLSDGQLDRLISETKHRFLELLDVESKSPAKLLVWRNRSEEIR